MNLFKEVIASLIEMMNPPHTHTLECYVRMLYQEIYWTVSIKIKTKQLLTVDMSGKQVECSLFAQVWTFTDTSDYSWMKYEPLEPIPSSAVTGDYGRD